MTRIETEKYKTYIQELISYLNIDERDINVWCDFIELLCYINPDKIIFREDIERELESYVDGGIQLASLKEVSMQMGFDVSDSHIFSNNGSFDWGADETSKNDLLSQITNMWFNHLKLRELSFGKYYPFKISNDLSEISSKNYLNLSKSNKLYLYFLLTSNRNGLSRKQQKRLEFDFEPIAFESFKSIIPINGKAHLMGKGSHTHMDFKKNKFGKFKLLADCLKVGIKVTENYFKSKDSGEGGFDFIGWLTYQDDLPNNHVFSGQATCMKNWEKKHYESTKEQMSGILDTSKIGSYTNTLFIPYHFRLGNDWAMPSHVVGKNYVLFDRFRILLNLNVAQVNAKLIPSLILKAIG